MGLLGQEIKSSMTSVTYTKFQEYVDSVNAGKSPGDPGYLDISPGDPGWPDPVSNDGISLDHINAIADPIEELFDDFDPPDPSDPVPGITPRPLITPVWENIDPLVEGIEEIEANTFRPIVTLNWEAMPERTDWDSTVTYNIGDTVLHNDKEYVSKVNDNTDNEPSSSTTSIWDEYTPTEIEVRIFRKAGTGTFRYISSIVEPDSSYVDEDVRFNTSYEYRLIRFNTGARFSQFSDIESITTSNFPVPLTPISAPTVNPAAGSVGVQIERDSGSAEISFYRVEFRSQSARSTNDGGFAIPTIPSWGSWEVLAEIDGDQIIHNRLSASRVYQYRFRAVSNYGVEGDYSPNSVEVIPFAQVDRDAMNLTYFAEVFHSEVPSGDNYRSIIYSPFSVDPQQDNFVSGRLENGTWWWQTDRGRVWTWNQTAGSWNTINRIPLLSPTSYSSLIDETISTANKEDIIDNYKILIFRKLTLERFAAKIKNIQEDVGFISIKEAFIELIDSYFNAFYGILVDASVESSNHSRSYVIDAYRNYYNTEIEFSEFLYEEYTQTLTRSFVNDNFSLSLGAVV